MPVLLLYHSAQQHGWQTIQNVTEAKMRSRGKDELKHDPPLLRTPSVHRDGGGKGDGEGDRGGRSHVDYVGFVDHGCCHFGAWGDVTVILLLFRPPLSTVRGVARVIAKVIVSSCSHVDYDGFVHYGCQRFWTPLLPIWPRK